MKRALTAGVSAGLAAGLVMMGLMALLGRGVWTTPDMIAAMWMGPEVADGTLSVATLVGFVTHMATSALMGLVAIPFIERLPPWRTVLVAIAYALGSYPLVFSAVISWANPLMFERAPMVPMTIGHTVFGVVLGLVYALLRPEAAPLPLRESVALRTPGQL